VPLNDLSREEKQLSNSAPGETNTRAGIDSRPHSAAQTTLKDESVKPSRQETKRIQAQRWTDEDVVSVIIVTALVLIVFVGLKRT
jgi:hypothetical protein